MDYFSKGLPDHVNDAIKNKYYVEAFLCLHMFLESDLIGCIIEKTYTIGNPTIIDDKEERTYPIKEDEWNKFDFKTAARVCLFMDIINEIFFQRLNEFNSTRNKLAHQLLKKDIDEKYLKKIIDDGIKIYFDNGPHEAPCNDRRIR